MKPLLLASGAVCACLFFDFVPAAAQPSSAKELSAHIPVESDWVFGSDRPVRFPVELSASEAWEAGELRFDVASDFGEPVASVRIGYRFAQDSVADDGLFRSRSEVALGSLGPGFYRASLLKGCDTLRAFQFGVDPERIVSEPDSRRGFDRFWRRTLAELERVDPHYSLMLRPGDSTPDRAVYDVTMQSLDGEVLRGYWAAPTDGERHPAVVVYQGYGAPTWIPGPEHYPGWCVLVIPPRGQGLNLPDNRYGEWIASGLGSPQRYYYRGAYADAVRSNDFVAAQPAFDGRNLFATGISQGGGLTLAAAALDARVSAAAPIVPFLSDWPDYFRLVDWPACLVRAGAWEQNLLPEDVYEVLSYFDLKNLTDRIACPVLMGFGMQDDITPPHTNFAAYNRIRAPKRWICYPHSGHLAAYDNMDRWIAESTRFFNENMR